MKPLTVAVIYSNYFERSQRQDYIAEEDVFDSRNFIEQALDKLNYSHLRIELGQDSSHFIKELKKKNFQVVFNLVEGALGQSSLEMNIPALLDLLQIPYTGSDCLAIGTSLNKVKTKEILSYHKIKVPSFNLYTTGKDITEREDYPLIVKPVAEDASIGINKDSVVYNYESLKQQVEYIIEQYKQPALVEQFIEGREFNVAIYQKGKEYKVLPVSELTYAQNIVPPICGYEAKWLTDSKEYKGTVPLVPAKIEKKLAERIEQTAIAAYQAMNIGDYGRIDIRLDEQENIYILEVNPNPCLSPGAGFERSLKAAGILFEDFVRDVIEHGLARGKRC